MEHGRPLRTVLVNPRYDAVPVERYAATENLGLGYLAAVLRHHGDKVRIIDGDASGLTREGIVDALVAEKPDFVGLTSLSHTIGDALHIGRTASARLPGTFFCLGGQHATYAAEELLRSEPFIGCVVRGEGELTLLELVERLRAGGSLRGLPGAYCRDQGEVILNPDRPPIADLDSLPWPARDCLDELLAQGARPTVLALLSSRGCHGRCAFCNSSTFFRLGGRGPAWRGRSAHDVVDELEALVTAHGDKLYGAVHFFDDNFVGPGVAGREHARAIAREMIARGLEVPFYIFCRVDSFDGDEELLALLRRAGLRSAFIGLESGEPATLKLFRKGTTREQNANAMRLMAKYGVATPASGFIMFHPYATFDELRRNAVFLLSLSQASFWNLSVTLTLFRGTKLVETVRRDGLLGEPRLHWGAYCYRFADPRVGRLAEAMSFAHHELMVRLDAEVRFVEETVMRLEAGLGQLKAVLAPQAIDAARATIAAVKERLLQMQRSSCDFFLDAVGLAESDRLADAFPARREAFLGRTELELDGLKSEFLRALAVLDGVAATLGPSGRGDKK